MKGLKFRIFALVLVAIAPVIALVVYLNLEHYRADADNAKRDMLRIVRIAAREQETIIHDAEHMLRLFALSLKDMKIDRYLCSRLAMDLKMDNSYFSAVGVASLNGDLFCSSDKTTKTLDFKDRDWFLETIKTKKPFIGSFIIGRISGKAALPISYPVLDNNGNVIGVVFLGVDLSWFEELAKKLHLAEGARLVVIDKEGIVLARYPDPEGVTGKKHHTGFVKHIISAKNEGTAESIGVDGQRRIYAYRPISIHGRESELYIYNSMPKKTHVQ